MLMLVHGLKKEWKKKQENLWIYLQIVFCKLTQHNYKIEYIHHKKMYYRARTGLYLCTFAEVGEVYLVPRKLKVSKQ